MTKVSPKCVSLSDRGVSPVSRDRAFVWLLDILLGKGPLCHSIIYGYAVRVCCKCSLYVCCAQHCRATPIV